MTFTEIKTKNRGVNKPKSFNEKYEIIQKNIKGILKIMYICILDNCPIYLYVYIMFLFYESKKKTYILLLHQASFFVLVQ